MNLSTALKRIKKSSNYREAHSPKFKLLETVSPKAPWKKGTFNVWHKITQKMLKDGMGRNVK